MALDLPLLAGLLLGLSLAGPPGPVNALMAEASTGRGPWKGVAIGLGATSADACYLGLALLGAIAVLRDRPTLHGAAALFGAALLAWFAWAAWRSARQPQGARAGRAGYAAGFLAALTSPFNLAWWLGPGTVLVASEGLLLPAGMFLGILAWVLMFNLGLARLGRRLPRLQEGVAYASAVILAAFAVLVGWTGLRLLGWAA